MGVPNCQLTTNFLANCQLTTIFLANCQLTTNLSYLLTFTFLQRKLLRHNPNFLSFITSVIKNKSTIHDSHARVIAIFIVLIS